MGDLLGLIEAVKQQVLAEVREFLINHCMEALEETMSILAQDIEDNYKSNIDSFYGYKTKKYIRFGEDEPGTGHGTNLYLPLTVNFSSDVISIEWEPGVMGKHHSDTKTTILDNVLEGTRYPGMGWQAGNFSKYFEGGGTLKEFFDSIENTIEDVAEKLFGEILDKVLATIIIE